MADDIINVYIVNEDDSRTELELPTDMSLNLMEGLKAAGYDDIKATCGGMALCGTCQVQVLEGAGKLKEPQDAELDMLDTLWNLTDESRLACQQRIDAGMDGLVLRILGEDKQAP